MARVLIAMMLCFLFVQLTASQSIPSVACIQASQERTTACPSFGNPQAICIKECQTATENLIRQCAVSYTAN